MYRLIAVRRVAHFHDLPGSEPMLRLRHDDWSVIVVTSAEPAATRTVESRVR
jgi:hypothetical protein